MAKGVRAKTSRKRARRADEKDRAFELKLQGFSTREIAKALGVSRSKAYNLISEGIRDRPAENVDAYREVEVDRLDRREQRCNEIMGAVDDVLRRHKTARRKLKDAEALVAADKMLLDAAARFFDGDRTLNRIAERRAKLLGLDAPTRNEHTGRDGAPLISLDMSKLSDEQIDRLVTAGELPGEPGDGAGGAPPASAG